MRAQNKARDFYHHGQLRKSWDAKAHGCSVKWRLCRKVDSIAAPYSQLPQLAQRKGALNDGKNVALNGSSQGTPFCMRCLTTSVGTRTIEAARPAPRPPDKDARNCLLCGTRFSTCCLIGSYTPMKMADAGRTPVMHIRGLVDQSLHAGAANIADDRDRAHHS